MILEGDRLLSGKDVATDDLLNLVADHIRDTRQYYRTDEDDSADEYDFTDGPVKLPQKRFWKSSKTKFKVIIDVLI